MDSSQESGDVRASPSSRASNNNGNGNGNGNKSGSRGRQDGAPAGQRRPLASESFGNEKGASVIIHRSSSSSTLVVHNYEMSQTSTTRAGLNSFQNDGSRGGAVDNSANSSRGSRRQPTNYADDYANRAGADEGRGFSQTGDWLPAAPPLESAQVSSPSQPGVNQVRLDGNDGRHSANNHSNVLERQRQPKQQQQQQQQQRQKQKVRRHQIMISNSDNNANGRQESSSKNVEGGNSRLNSRATANDYGYEFANDDGDYSLIDTPDLHGRPARTMAPSSAATTQSDRVNFYNNLLQNDGIRLAQRSSNKLHEIQPIASQHDDGLALSSRQGARESTRGRGRESAPPARAKSATLPAGHSSKEAARQQVVARDQAARKDAIAPMRSAQRVSTNRLDGSQATVTGDPFGANPMAPYGSFGSSSQRASRSSLSTRPSRVGRYVNHYPASRQPQEAAPKRHTSPYAFHVPLYRQMPALRSKSAHPTNSRGQQARSSSVQYYGAGGGEQDEHSSDAEYFEDDHDHVLARAEIKQTRYGYVAPLDRAQSRLNLEEAPLRKFDKSLRLQTIGHIPSLVQVSVDDSLLASSRGPHVVYSDQTPGGHGNLSEGDLLKAHRVAWSHSDKFDVGHDNPFRPGTELSLEADLMVRLIKRGYPIDELPHLVQTTKEFLANKRNDPHARSKSCDKLGASSTRMSPKRASGYLNSNLRQFNEQTPYDVEEETHKMGSARHGGRVPQSKSHSQLVGERNVELDEGHQLEDLEPFKRILAGRMSRAKSMPRFEYSTKSSAATLGASNVQLGPTLNDDTDSLDKLITDIEREISDLLVANSIEPTGRDENFKNGMEKAKQTRSNERALKSHTRTRPGQPGGMDLSKQGQVLRRPSGGSQEEKPTNSRMRKIVPSASAQSFAETRGPTPREDLTHSESSGLLLGSDEESTVVVKRKFRCCMVQ